MPVSSPRGGGHSWATSRSAATGPARACPSPPAPSGCPPAKAPRVWTSWSPGWKPGRLCRSTGMPTVVAVGGGVLTDMAGLAASLFLRGVAWHCWPTTLLAQVDAGLGGKTAVNLAAGQEPGREPSIPRSGWWCARTSCRPCRSATGKQAPGSSSSMRSSKAIWTGRSGCWSAQTPGLEDLRALLAAEGRSGASGSQGIERAQAAQPGPYPGACPGIRIALPAPARRGRGPGDPGRLPAWRRRQGLAPFPPDFLRRFAERLRPLADRIPPWEACLPILARDKKALGESKESKDSTIHCVLPVPGQRALLRLLPPNAWASAHARLVALLT